MLLVGLTGGIAAGKSTVARRFADHHGFPVIDADQVARTVVEPGQPALEEIRQRFGEEVIAEDGTLDRLKLGSVVFADEPARLDLNAITHPPISEEIRRRVGEHAGHDGPVVVDLALLVEMGKAGDYPVVVVVAASPDTQYRRLVEQRGMDPDAAWDRINSQAPVADKLAVATHVIWNDGSLDELRDHTDQVARELRAAATAGTDGLDTYPWTR